jgi:hypothetical protein
LLYSTLLLASFFTPFRAASMLNSRICNDVRISAELQERHAGVALRGSSRFCSVWLSHSSFCPQLLHVCRSDLSAHTGVAAKDTPASSCSTTACSLLPVRMSSPPVPWHEFTQRSPASRMMKELEADPELAVAEEMSVFGMKPI